MHDIARHHVARVGSSCILPARLYLRFSRSSVMAWSRPWRSSYRTPSVVSLGVCTNIVRHAYNHIRAIETSSILSCCSDILAKWTGLPIVFIVPNTLASLYQYPYPAWFSPMRSDVFFLGSDESLPLIFLSSVYMCVHIWKQISFCQTLKLEQTDCDKEELNI